jgi:hypothetical protein
MVFFEDMEEFITQVNISRRIGGGGGVCENYDDCLKAVSQCYDAEGEQVASRLVISLRRFACQDLEAALVPLIDKVFQTAQVLSRKNKKWKFFVEDEV